MAKPKPSAKPKTTKSKTLSTIEKAKRLPETARSGRIIRKPRKFMDENSPVRTKRKSEKQKNPSNNNNVQEKDQQKQIKKFFPSTEKTYKIPESPTKSNDIYDFLSLTNKAERRESDPVMKNIIAKKNVDLKVYKNGKFTTKRKRNVKKTKTVPETIPSPTQKPVQLEEPMVDITLDTSQSDFTFTNVVNSTPANNKSQMHAGPRQSSTAIASPSVGGHLSPAPPSTIELTFKSPPLRNDLRRNAIMNSNRQHTAAEKIKLLAQAAKLIPRMSSTPLVRKPSVPYRAPKALSPIAPLINCTMRVEEGEHYSLPRLNYFGRSSDLTPSFSSDAIPQTPKKPSLSVINDSNEENIPPPDESLPLDSKVIIEKPTERRPFKEIQILRNEPLPNWNSNLKRTSKALDYDNLDDVIQKRNSEMYQPHKSYSKKTPTKTDITSDISKCFGFDDLIKSTPAKNRSNVFEENNTSQVTEIINVLKEQRDCRKIDESIIFATPRKTNMPVPNLFSPPRELPKKNPKDMFSKNRKDESLGTVDETIDSNSSSIINKSICLFKDPESSFDTTKMHATYRAPTKRSRKIRKLNDFVYDYESGESEEENEESPSKKSKKRKKKNDSRDTGDSENESEEVKRPRKKKRTKDDEELENFCKLLNAEFEEIEKVEIPVECE